MTLLHLAARCRSPACTLHYFSSSRLVFRARGSDHRGHKINLSEFLFIFSSSKVSLRFSLFVVILSFAHFLLLLYSCGLAYLTLLCRALPCLALVYRVKLNLVLIFLFFFSVAWGQSSSHFVCRRWQLAVCNKNAAIKREHFSCFYGSVREWICERRRLDSASALLERNWGRQTATCLILNSFRDRICPVSGPRALRCHIPPRQTCASTAQRHTTQRFSE